MDQELFTLLFSIFMIVATLFFMFYYKTRIEPVRLVGQEPDLTMMQRNRANQPLNDMKVKGFQNPFNILLDSIKSNSNDGIFFKLILNIEKSCSMAIGWHVDIDPFYEKFYRSIYDCFYNDENRFLMDCSDNASYHEINGSENKEFKFDIPDKCKDVFKVNEGLEQTRKAFPVVVCLYRKMEDLEYLDPNDIVAGVWIFHLKDKKMESKQLFNFLKCKNNRIVNISRLFTEEENLCVVCRVNTSNQVLLPCNHTCLCAECLPRCGRKCPLCRTQFDNKFELPE